MLAAITINGAHIANTEYSPFYLNFGYHPVFWWDLPDRREPGPGVEEEAVRGIVHRMKDYLKMVRKAFKKEQDRAAAYADRRRSDYQCKEGQYVLINRSGITEGSSAVTGGRWRREQWDLLWSREC